MQPFWDVFWSDLRALTAFAFPMLVLALPASALAALLGGVPFGFGSWRRLLRSAVRGYVLGTLSALVLSMCIELLLTAEGFPQSRRTLRTAAFWQLLVAGPLLAFLFAFLAARRYAPTVGQVRCYSLRRLFVYQLIAASLLGWWTFTRQSEIRERQILLAWQIRERDAKALFEPLGWWVEAPVDRNEIYLHAGPHYRPISDESLTPIAIHGAITAVYVRSNDITDEGLRRLRGANRIRGLHIHADRVTDDGVASLAELPRLRYLDLQSPHLTGRSLQTLANIRSLRFLTISRAHLTDEDLAAFGQSRPGLNVRLVEP